MSLGLVKSPAHGSFDSAELAPELAGVQPNCVYRHEDDTYQFDFNIEFDGPELAASLALNASVVFGDEVPEISAARSLRAVRSGLKSLTYPNSRIMRSAKHVDRDAAHNLFQARSDIQGLVTAIDHPERHRMVPATLSLYDELTASFEVDESLNHIKPANLRRLCLEYGIALNESALQSLKGRERDTYVNAFDYVEDSQTLKELLRIKKFRRTVILPEEEDASFLADNDEWPKGGWAEKADAVQLLRMLPDSAQELDSLGVRWDVLIRDDSSPRHIVRPQLLVRSDTKQRNEEVRTQPKRAHVWTRPETYFIFESPKPEYDRTTHTVVHISPVLGIVLLMNNLVERKVLNDTLRTALFSSERSKAYWQHSPDKALGLSPLLAQSTKVQSDVLDNSRFKLLTEHFELDL